MEGCSCIKRRDGWCPRWRRSPPEVKSSASPTSRKASCETSKSSSSDEISCQTAVSSERPSQPARSPSPLAHDDPSTHLPRPRLSQYVCCLSLCSTNELTCPAPFPPSPGRRRRVPGRPAHRPTGGNALFDLAYPSSGRQGRQPGRPVARSLSSSSDDGGRVELVGAVESDGLWVREALASYGVGVEGVPERGDGSGHHPTRRSGRELYQ